MNNLQVIENNDQRVLTTAQIAKEYETTERRISENFNANKSRYVEGKHYYCLTGEALKEFKNGEYGKTVFANINKFYLWTEKGAFLHAKSLNTDKAWEAYEFLVDTYFAVKEKKQLSPIEMIASIANNAVETERRLKLAEAKQQEQETAIANTNQRIDNMCEILSFDRNTWRKDSRRIVSKIAGITGENYSFIYDEIYDLLEERAECDLRMRLDNKYDRMSERGVCKSKLDKLNYLDVIEDDKKLIEIYIAIVKDLAIKYGVCL